jgi:hypothetical protein
VPWKATAAELFWAGANNMKAVGFEILEVDIGTLFT